jgi:hypothetical protein
VQIITSLSFLTLLSTLPTLLFAEGFLLFNPAYPGVTIGPWTQPRTVAPHQTHEVFFEHEDMLGLVAAMGLLLGCNLTPLQREAAIVGTGFPVLPSRSTLFPSDVDYHYPGDMAIYRGDMSILRRMLLIKSFYGSYTGGSAWEEASGVGLVAGIGAGISSDGRGWHNLAAKLEATHRQPVHDSYRDVSSGDVAYGGSGSSSSSSGAAAAEEAEAGKGEEDIGFTQYLDSLLLVEEEEGEEEPAKKKTSASEVKTSDSKEAAAAKESVAEDEEDDLDSELLSGLADLCSSAAADVAYSDAWLTSFTSKMSALGDSKKKGDDDDEDPSTSRGRNVVMAPRIGRGGRLLFDRMHVDSLEGSSGAGDGEDGTPSESAGSLIAAFRSGADHALKIRNKHLRRQRCRSWLLLLGGLEPFLPSPLLEALKVSTTAMQDFYQLLSAAESFVSTLSAFKLLQGYGYGGDPTDPHAQHIHSFGEQLDIHLSGSCSTSQMNHLGGDSKQASDPTVAMAVGGAAQREIGLSGVTTALLAPSKFNRVGDEMTAAIIGGGSNSLHRRSVFGDSKPFAAVTGSAADKDILADDRWDAFVDGQGPIPLLSGDKRKRAAVASASAASDALRAKLNMAVDGGGVSENDPLFAELTGGGGGGGDKLALSGDRKRRKLTTVEPLEAVASGVSEVFEKGAAEEARLKELVARKASAAAAAGAAAAAVAGPTFRRAARDSRGIIIKGAHTAHPAPHGIQIADLVSLPSHPVEASEGEQKILADSINFNHDKFREMWSKADDSDDEDMVSRASKLATSKRSLIGPQSLAALAFEESQLQYFESAMKKVEAGSY